MQPFVHLILNDIDNWGFEKCKCNGFSQLLFGNYSLAVIRYELSLEIRASVYQHWYQQHYPKMFSVQLFQHHVMILFCLLSAQW